MALIWVLAILVLLATSGAWVVPTDFNALTGNASSHFLKDINKRQTAACDGGLLDDEAPNCRALCGSSCAVHKRAVAEGIVSQRIDQEGNNATKLDRNLSTERGLFKRTFEEILQGGIVDYGAAQFHGDTLDTLYGAPIGLTTMEGGSEPTDATVVVSKSFGDLPFALGTPGLHGCTVVAVISRRGVYMGHFFESASWSIGRARGLQQFDLRVANFFKEAGDYQGFGGPDQEVVDDDWVRNFNADGDDSRAYIMHPRREAFPTSYRRPQYRSKIQRLKEAIRDQLPGLPILTYHYVAAEVDDEAEEAQLDSRQRGVALFQYDPDGRGEGIRGWRLFFEHYLFQDFDEPPIGSEGGIPDM